jgi:hypothetical protein
MEWIVLEGGSNPISPFVCLSTLKHKAKYKKGSDGLLPIKTTCAKLLYF